jgi:hypothetical protein
MVTKASQSKKAKKRTLRTKKLHAGCGGKIKSTLGHGKRFGASVCIACGVFFN